MTAADEVHAAGRRFEQAVEEGHERAPVAGAEQGGVQQGRDRPGVGIDVERQLGSIFISTPDYGTRSSTVLALEDDGGALFVECGFNAEGQPRGSSGVAFSLE